MDDWDDEEPTFQPPKPKFAGRQQADDDWGQNKQNASTDGKFDDISFEIDRNRVGLVIGKGGSTIKDIEQRFNVSMKIDKEAGQNGNAIVNINGGNSNDAKRYIDEKFLRQNNSNDRNRSSYQSRDYSRDRNRDNDNREYSRDRTNNRSNNNGSNNQNGADAGEHKQQFDIYPDKVGSVIGRGGSKINELQSKHNVNIKVDRDPKENGMSEVIVRGKKYNDVEAAVSDIKDLIRDPFAPQKAPPPEPMDFEPIDWQKAARESEEATRAKWAKLPPLEKCFYKEHPNVTNMTPERVAAIRAENNNTTVDRTFKDQGEQAPIPNPIESFDQCFAEYPDLMEEIRKQGFPKPSPIQAQAWPVLLKGEDLIGIAQTGTGKTLAFLLPAMIHTEYQTIPRSQRGGANVLVMAPTRELAQQIEKEVAKYQFRGMKAVCAVGGNDRRSQINHIQSGAEIIIATPGRLNDLIQSNVIDVQTITYLVLDEADRMLDLGFEPQIRKVMLNIRPDRQTVMTSATWPAGVRRLAESYMKNPIQVCVGSLDLAAVHSVTQIITMIEEDDKFNTVMEFVVNMDPEEKVIIFCGKKSRADDLSSEISLKNIGCQCIHGDRDQADREQALADIKSGEVNILIATDVASRGIDIGDITHVINYDFPRQIEEYVHRVGRTGRAGKTGTSISFFTRTDWAQADELIKILEEAEQNVPDELRGTKNRFDSMKERRARENSSFGGRRGGGRGRGGGGGRPRW